MVKTFTKGVGRLALDRYDAQDHFDGYNFRHNSDQIDVIPPLSIQNVLYGNVATSLSAIATYILTDQLNGVGFIALSDGFDTYHNSDITPNTPYDAFVPSINAAIDDLLNNANNPQHHRIRDGGIIFLKAGTYIVTDTITIPPGITIMGEGFGTKIVNAISNMLTPRPLFEIQADTSRIPDVGEGDPVNKFMFARETRFFNLVIADNFVEPKFLGDLTFKDPKNTDGYAPLISVQEGAFFSCDNVKFIGKVHIDGGGIVTQATSYAIRTDDLVPISTGTIINVNNCFIDGISVAVAYDGLNGANDYVSFTNNQVRTYGFLHADFTLPQNNAMLRLNSCNATVTNNYCWGYDTTVTSLVFVPSAPAPATLQAYPRMTVMDNNIAVKKASNSINTTFDYLRFDPSIVAAIDTKLTRLVFGNNFDGIITIDGAFSFRRQRVVSSNYTIDSSGSDYLLLVDTTGGVVNITLPNPANNLGRQLIIKDAKGNAGTHAIVVVSFAGENIEDSAGSKTFSSNWASLSLTSDGISWYLI